MTFSIYRQSRSTRFVSALLAVVFSLAVSSVGVATPGSLPEQADVPEHAAAAGGTEVVEPSEEAVDEAGEEATEEPAEEPARTVPEPTAGEPAAAGEPALDEVPTERSLQVEELHAPEPEAQELSEAPAVLDLPAASTENACSVPVVFTLWAGQDIDSGSVKVWNDEENLFVQFLAEDGWYLAESHVYVGTEFPDSVAPGSFPYSAEHDPAVDTYTYTIPLTWSPGTGLYVLAHGVVLQPEEQGDSETAWGGDQPFEGPRWGFFLDFEIQECEEPELEGAIQVEKTADAAVVLAGEEVLYTFVVENTGESTLYDISVDDDHLGHVGDISSLEPSASVELTASAILTETTTNVVVAAGFDDEQNEFSDDDEATVEVVNPAIEVLKDSDAPEGGVPEGTEVTYSFIVTNVGDVTLYDITVDDDHIGHIGDIPSLEPGASVESTASAVLIESTTNTVVAAGEDEYGHPVEDDDVHNVDTFLPFTPDDPEEPEEPEDPTGPEGPEDPDEPEEADEDDLPFLPFTGGEFGTLSVTALAAALVGLALRRWSSAIRA